MSFEANFFIVPSRIRKLPKMTLAFLDVYETIFQFWNNGKPCFLSNSMIMKRTGIKSERHIREALSYFEAAGELLRKTIKGKRYLVQPEMKVEILEDDEQKLSTAPGSTEPPPRLHSAPHPGSTEPHNNNNINNKNFNKKHRYPDKNINNKIFSDVTNQSTSYKEDNTVYESKPEVRDKARKEILKTLGINRQEKKRESQPFYDKSGNPPF